MNAVVFRPTLDISRLFEISPLIITGRSSYRQVRSFVHIVDGPFFRITINACLFVGYDRFVKLWDTEKGQCISRFTNKKVCYCVKFNPEEDKQHLFVGGTSDKKIVCVSIKMR